MRNLISIAIVYLFTFQINGQCVINPNNVDTLFLGTDIYFVVQENKTWLQADSCAATFGFQLANIDSQAEQDSLFRFINTLGIVTSNTAAPDGGGAAYLWIGGNDRTSEGAWVWQTRQTSQPQFWQGDRNGSPVGGLYNNWGNEPDNFQNQDALGLALTNWPFGVAGEWNDVDEGNSLYFIMEFNTGLGLQENTRTPSIQIYPNPAGEIINFSTDLKINYNSTIQIYSLEGKMVREFTYSNQNQIDISNLPKGNYFLLINGEKSAPFQLQ